jgi:hypothetical protein
MPASRRALVVALACLSNFSLSCFAAAQLSDQVVRVTDSSPAADPVMGVNIHLEDHAGTSPGKRNASHSRIVAGAGSERSGRRRLHRAVCRKRRPVRGVHHCECRAIDRAVSNGERSSDSFRSGSKKRTPNHSVCIARSAIWCATGRVTECAGHAVRGSTRRSRKRTGGGFERKRVSEISCGRPLSRSERPAGSQSRERGLCASYTCKIEAGQSQTQSSEEGGASGERRCWHCSEHRC